MESVGMLTGMVLVGAIALAWIAVQARHERR